MAKVLVIEDTPEYIEMLTSLLSDYEVYAAKEGKKAWRWRSLSNPI
ncbi:hypothetical protein [Sulfurospirillum cavolei]|nr:hypothetical protein [Sulfurospirillum cavolei]